MGASLTIEPRPQRPAGLEAAEPAPRVEQRPFAIRDGNQDARRERLVAAGLRPTSVLDRRMFKSIYFREPSGVLFELTTDQPGFVFEPPDRLGESLVLIGDLEDRRAELEQRFPLLASPRASTTRERISA